jgi:hypothetical protein
MVLIGYFSLYRLKQSQIMLIIISVIAMGYLGVIWTVVKSDYRFFLNQDSGQQVVNVGTADALNYLADKVTDVRSSDLERGMEMLVDRIAYIDFFSSVMNYVPESKPHEDGKLTKDAILHILLPRLFYPEKPAIDDSKHLTKYSGVVYADASAGTSIALGYFGDLYIDYGKFYMMIALFFLGKITGHIIRSVYRTSLNTFWAMAIMLPVFMLVFEFENALIKLIGGLVVFWIVVTLFNKYIAPRVDTFLKQ